MYDCYSPIPAVPTLCRRGREMGVVEDSELEVTEDVFEYVNESEYAKIVQQRQEEGFVLDDGQQSCCSNKCAE